MDMEIFLSGRNLVKTFGQGKGVFHLDIEVRSGEVLGFLGPNGAGKTTTILMLLGLVYPDQGVVKMFGNKLTPVTSYQYMPEVGIMFGDIAFEGHLKIIDIFKRQAAFLGMKDLKPLLALAKELKIDMDKRFSQLSLGNKKKVGIVTALAHKPRLLVLDEPTSGLDPLVQQTFQKYILKFKNAGAAILLSSHVLTEVESVCDKVLMIRDGKKILESDIHTILEKANRVFRFPQAVSQKVINLLNQSPIEVNFKSVNQEVLAYTGDPERCLRFLVENNITNFYLERPSLENMFLGEYESSKVIKTAQPLRPKEPVQL